MKNSNNLKQDLRKKLLSQRNQLDEAFISEQSDNMAKQLYAWPYYQQAKIMMLFLSMKHEPQMMKIIANAWLQGKTVCVPSMRQEFGVMDAAVIHHMNDLVRGRLNLLEPNPINLEVLDPKIIDVIVVPGVGYDQKGNRVGMGAGYYDRFIPRAPQALLIGAVWSSQIVESIPCSYYDKPVHYLLNEDGIIKCDSSKP
jgi:5-formyltetrahydrofolate cyclo-ligase